jgi:hypothetical protein
MSRGGATPRATRAMARGATMISAYYLLKNKLAQDAALVWPNSPIAGLLDRPREGSFCIGLPSPRSLAWSQERAAMRTATAHASRLRPTTYTATTLLGRRSRPSALLCVTQRGGTLPGRRLLTRLLPAARLSADTAMSD